MPRAPRIEYPGALYHIMSRGNHLERILKDNTDRSNWQPIANSMPLFLF